MKEHVIYLDTGDDVPSTLDKLSWVKTARVLLVWPGKGNPLCTRYDLVRISRYAQRRGLQLGLVSFHPEVRGNARELGLPLFSSLEHLPEDRWVQLRSTELTFSLASTITLGGNINNTLQEPVHDDIERGDEIDTPIEQTAGDDSDPVMDTGQGQRNSNGLGKFGPVDGNIPESSSSRTAMESGKTSRIGGRRKSSAGVRVVSVLLVVCSLLALLAVSVPSAELFIVPEISNGETEIPIRFDPAEVSLIPGDIPVYERVETFTVTQYFLTTGRAVVGDTYAQGYVVFENPGATDVSVPSGTGVRTDRSVRFETLKTINLRAGEVSEKVPVRAILAGESGNVGEGEILWLDGLPGLYLTVFNPEAITGGNTVRVYAVSSYDLRSAEKTMRETIEQEMELRASQLIEENEIILPGSVELIDVREGETGVELGDVAEGFQLNWNARISMAVVQMNQVNQAGVDLLAGEISSESFLISGSLAPVIVSSGDADGEAWDLLVQYQTAEKVDFQLISAWLAGKSVRQSVPVLIEQYSLVITPYVHRFPSWLPFFPLIPSRIQIFWAWGQL